MSATGTKLAARLAAGEAQAFADLYDEYGHRLYAYLLGRTGRVERAIEELSPYSTSRQIKARFRLHARRESDLRWVRYMTALHEGGRING